MNDSLHLPEPVSSHTELVPVQYSGETTTEDRLVQMPLFKRNAVVTMHRGHAADFAEYVWLLQHGDTGVWYERPSKAARKKLASAASSNEEPEELPAAESPRPVTLDTPRVWASPALTTPTDDDAYDCTLGHERGDFSDTCRQCTEDRSDALDACGLVYYVVLSTFQANDPFIYGAHFNGRPLYKLVKCGSREAAAAEAFYASGVDGWNVAFSCVMREGETFEERTGPVERVEELWNLADDCEDDNLIRVFY